MWRSLHLRGPTRVDSKGIFEQVKDVEHDSVPWLAGWWCRLMKRPTPKRGSGTDERKDNVSSAVASRGANALSNCTSARKNQDYYQHATYEQLKGMQIKVKVWRWREDKSKKGKVWWQRGGCGGIQCKPHLGCLRHAAQTEENERLHISFQDHWSRENSHSVHNL